MLSRRWMPDPLSVLIEPFRDELPDDSDIKFTHGDLHQSNIIVSTSKPRRVLAVVDWEQSGWFPAYWEARKAKWTVDWEEDWAEKYLPKIVEQFPGPEDAWNYYMAAMGVTG